MARYRLEALQPLHVIVPNLSHDHDTVGRAVILLKLPSARDLNPKEAIYNSY